MANVPQTIGELFKAKAVTEADIVAAVDAFMAAPSTSAFVFGEGYRINLAEVVRAHEWASVTTENEKATDYLKRAAVRTRILFALPRGVTTLQGDMVDRKIMYDSVRNQIFVTHFHLLAGG